MLGLAHWSDESLPKIWDINLNRSRGYQVSPTYFRHTEGQIERETDEQMEE